MLSSCILLAAMSVGQCPGGSCSISSDIQPSNMVLMPRVQAVRVVQQPAPQVFAKAAPPQQKYQWIPIEHEGLSFEVWGFYTSDGMARWFPELPQNRNSWYEARKASKSVRTYARQTSKDELGWLSVKHEGLTFDVWGYVEDDQIVWETKLPENLDSWYEARKLRKMQVAARQAAQKAKMAEPPLSRASFNVIK